MRVAVAITPNASIRNKLSRYSKASDIPPEPRMRPHIILLAGLGKTNKRIAADPGIGEPQAGRWRNRFARQGLPGIAKDKSWEGPS